MIGNLKASFGPEDFDDYALWLRHMLEPAVPSSGVLWVLRAVLLACVVAPVTCATILFVRARAVRAGSFRRKGLPLRSFVAHKHAGYRGGPAAVHHLRRSRPDYGTRPVASAEYSPMTSTRSFAYDNLVHSFDQPWVSAFYILAMLTLALHLSHRLWTAVTDLGTTGRWTRQVARVAAVSLCCPSWSALSHCRSPF